MMGIRRNSSELQVSPKILEEFRSAPTAIISDNIDRLPGAVGLKPFHRRGRMVGTALTVRTPAGDNRAIHEALELARIGDVLVVDGGGSVDRALIGEIIVAIAVSKGLAGIVVDGAIRDVAAIAANDFPVFARGAIHRGPYKNGPGETGVTVGIGGMVVRPGDIVVGDEDGVVAFQQSIAEKLLQAVRAQEAQEAEILLSIREGRYAGAYRSASVVRK